MSTLFFLHIHQPKLYHMLAAAAAQLPEKNGLEDVAAIVPLKPALQVQPEPTLVPDESAGQVVAAQLPEKNGLK